MTSTRSSSRRFRLTTGLALAAALLLACPACQRRGAQPLQLPTPLVVRVVGRDFHWHFTYPGPDGDFGTADDLVSARELHVPVRRPVKLEVTSQDYIYSFRAPDLGLKELAVPDLLFSINFTPQSVGRYALEVDPMCGYRFAHDDDAMGQMVVESIDSLRDWLDNHSKSR